MMSLIAVAAACYRDAMILPSIRPQEEEAAEEAGVGQEAHEEPGQGGRAPGGVHGPALHGPLPGRHVTRQWSTAARVHDGRALDPAPHPPLYISALLTARCLDCPAEGVWGQRVPERFFLMGHDFARVTLYIQALDG